MSPCKTEKYHLSRWFPYIGLPYELVLLARLLHLLLHVPALASNMNACMVLRSDLTEAMSQQCDRVDLYTAKLHTHACINGDV